MLRHDVPRPPIYCQLWMPMTFERIENTICRVGLHVDKERESGCDGTVWRHEEGGGMYES